MSSGARRHHLTDHEFSNLLFGEQPGEAVAAHLAACDHCRQELEAVGGSLGDLRDLGTAWAQLKAPALVAIPSRLARRVASVPPWVSGLTATAAAGVLAFGMGLHSAPAHKGNEKAAVNPEPRATLAEDNRLMLSIDQELSYSAPDSVGTRQGEIHHGEHPIPGAVLD